MFFALQQKKNAPVSHHEENNFSICKNNKYFSKKIRLPSKRPQNNTLFFLTLLFI